MLQVRNYLDSDAQQVEICFAELQSFEKFLETNRADGESIATAYREHLLDECRRWDGCILVADQDGQVVGFVCVLSHYDSGEMIEANTDCACVTDLVVTSSMRRHGIGRRLLQEAEAFAKERGATVFRVGVLARNTIARSLYEHEGFREFEVGLVKDISKPLGDISA